MLAAFLCLALAPDCVSPATSHCNEDAGMLELRP